MDPKDLEKYSSAITLSDMEVFVFPELMYSLILADIMSPVLWRWRDLDCFRKLDGKSEYRKLMRLKQFIMDEYEFNLDLETWGLTSRQAELARFADYVSQEDIAASNALFGYHGDRYYFDVDIRRHFGLDKYDSDVIPYWKTETIEAMNAFRLKHGYTKAAGECVSLAALYAAAAFVVCGIPLEDIYAILTPLHSQNFIDVQGGILTNNRRLVTRAMWFNGTEISNKAQRALRNENVTIVAHCSGCIHCLYGKATIDPVRYEYFSRRLASYLTERLTLQTFASFLRTHRHYQNRFQVCRDCHGKPMFLPAEVLFHYEHGSKYRIADNTYEKLLAEVGDEDFVSYELPGRIRCDHLEALIKKERIDLRKESGRTVLAQFLARAVPGAGELVKSLADFLHTEAKLPAAAKRYVCSELIEITTAMGREQVLEYLASVRKRSPTADLAFYAYRDMENCDWAPFAKAAVERNPVSLSRTEAMEPQAVYKWLRDMPDDSIYEGGRLAQPDEVANYLTGDGLEKAFFMANVMRSWDPEHRIDISAENAKAAAEQNGRAYRFDSAKRLRGRLRIVPGEPRYEVDRC